MNESGKSAADAKELLTRVKSRELFLGEKFRVAAEPFALPREQIVFLEKLGPVLHSFYQACNLIYRRSWKEGRCPWVADYLDKGKPEQIVRLARQKKFNGDLPLVLRPDLLVTEEGFALTELDSVPGGIGLTGFLSRTYHQHSPDAQIAGGQEDLMIQSFSRALQSLSGAGSSAQIAICVSQESAMYRPEMDWISREMNVYGVHTVVVSPEDLDYRDDGVYVQQTRIDLIYRFFELFDLPALPGCQLLLDAVEKQMVRVTPPLKPVLEEKMWFALFRHPDLKDQWRRELGDRGIEMMERLIPQTTVMDPAPLPPHALIAGLGINHWEQLKVFTQKERDLIIKISGFSELAWGAKGVYYGSDMSQDDWKETVDQALANFETNPSIIQKFSTTTLREQAYFDEEGNIQKMKGRVRLCPYYFTINEHPVFSGALATICPADKKLIHGMDVAILSPLAVSP